MILWFLNWFHFKQNEFILTTCIASVAFWLALWNGVQLMMKSQTFKQYECTEIGSIDAIIDKMAFTIL